MEGEVFHNRRLRRSFRLSAFHSTTNLVVFHSFHVPIELSHPAHKECVRLYDGERCRKRVRRCCHDSKIRIVVEALFHARNSYSEERVEFRENCPPDFVNKCMATKS